MPAVANSQCLEHTSFPPRPQNGTISPTHASNNDNRNELPIVLQADTDIHVFGNKFQF